MDPSMAGTRPADEVDERLQRYVCAVESGGRPQREFESAAAGLDPPSSRRLRERVDEFHRLGALLDRRDGDSLAGRLLAGRYRLLHEIGRGGMGAVYEAVDVRLERRVAVKLLLEAAALNDESRRMFLREAVLVARLQHPNLVSVHELAREGELEFIVMDLVAGRDLAHVLRQVRQALDAAGGREAGRPRDAGLLAEAIERPVPAGAPDLLQGSWFEAAARVALEIARTMEAAHAAGVIHRDLKPQNVLLRGGGAPVILDFGLAGVRQDGGEARTRGLFGTVSYLAPEQASEGEMGAEPRTDVYQAGLVLYELLTLQRAFPGDSAAQVLGLIGRGEFRRPRALDRGIPFELEAICLRAMELRPAARYASMTELREDLERYLGGREPPLAARGGAIASATRAVRYGLRRRRVQAVAASALLAGAVGGWLAFQWLFPPSILPAELRAYRYRPATGELLVAPAFDSVRKDDILGVAVETGRPCTLYALSVFGQRDPPTWVAPMKPQLAAATPAPTDSWGLLVPEGRQQVHCTEITSASADIPYEGLWVFASAEPNPRLDDWMSELARLADAQSGAPGIPLARARQLLVDGPPVLRGAAVQVSGDERAALARLVSSAAASDQVDWPLEGLMRYVVAYRVEAE